MYIPSQPSYSLLDLHHEPMVVGMHLNLDGTEASALKHQVLGMCSRHGNLSQTVLAEL